MTERAPAVRRVIKLLGNRHTGGRSIPASDRKHVQHGDERVTALRDIPEGGAGGRIDSGQRDPHDRLVRLGTDRSLAKHGHSRLTLARTGVSLAIRRS